MRAICVIFATLSLSLLRLAAHADHTPETRKTYIRGLPTWCSSPADCIQTPVRLIHIEGSIAWVRAMGRDWKVVGRYGDGNGLFTAPGKTYLCPISLKAGTARCALIKPGGKI